MAQSNSVKVTLIVVATVVVLAIVALAVFLSLRPGVTIMSNGMAQVKAMPDVVSIYINIETIGKTTKEANDKNTVIFDSLSTELIKLGLERKDITTESFNVYPEYDWNNGNQQLIDYKATHILKIELTLTQGTNDIGDIIDVVSNENAYVSSINFELSLAKQNEYKAQALKLATADAKIKAESIALGAGKKLGSIVSITDSSFNYYPYALYTKDAMVGAAESNSQARQTIVNLQPGEQDVTAQVSVMYKLV
jgi:hypothetical protein